MFQVEETDTSQVYLDGLVGEGCTKVGAEIAQGEFGGRQRGNVMSAAERHVR